MRILKSILFTFIVINLMACKTMNGMPTKQVDLILKKDNLIAKDCDIQCINKNNQELKSLTELVKNYNDVERNRWIDLNLIRINSAYDIFIRELQNSKAGWTISTALIDLAFNVASSLTPSAGVKANYAAASAMLTGSNNIIDKEAFHEKTISALVTAMDARRAKAIVIIRKGMVKSTTLYPLSAAHEDLLAYQRASSFAGGLSFIEVASQKDITESEKDIEEIKDNIVLDTKSVNEKYCIRLSLDNIDVNKYTIKLNGESIESQFKSFYFDIFSASADGKSKDDITNQILGQIFNKPSTYINEVYKKLEKYNLLKIKCEEYK